MQLKPAQLAIVTEFQLELTATKNTARLSLTDYLSNLQTKPSIRARPPCLSIADL